MLEQLSVVRPSRERSRKDMCTTLPRECYAHPLSRIALSYAIKCEQPGPIARTRHSDFITPKPSSSDRRFCLQSISGYPLLIAAPQGGARSSQSRFSQSSLPEKR